MVALPSLWPQWDVLSHGNQVQEVSRIPNGSNPGNCISLLRVSNQSINQSFLAPPPSTELNAHCDAELIPP
jgi:homeobox-leucine zipper protein